MRKKEKKPLKKKDLDTCQKTCPQNSTLDVDNCPYKNCESCDIIPASCFVKHPPKGIFSEEELKKMSLFIGAGEIDNITTDDGITLPADFFIRSGLSKFKKTQNPIYAFRAFIFAHEAGLYPPVFILQFMADVFKQYLEQLGDVSLDKLFGFKRWKGQDDAFKQYFLEWRDEKLMIDIYRLRRVFGISVREAAVMVDAKLKEIPEREFNNTGLNIKKLGFDKLREKYLKKWKHILENEPESYRESNPFSTLDKLEYLKSYPEYSIPSKLKRLYKVS